MENKVLNQLPQVILTLVAMYLAFNDQYNPAFFLIGLAILNNLREINNR